jgi:hypothetical protein
MLSRRHVLTTLAIASVAVATLAPRRSATAEEAPCDAWDVEYVLSGMLQLSDTPMNAGDGNYAIGPGRMVLRYANVDGRPGGAVEMRAYVMRERFEIESRALFWKTHVLNDSSTTVAYDGCGVAARGVLEGTTLRWSTSIAGSRTDGTMTCTGSMCGSFGAPPPGRSELHVPPHPVLFNSLQFARDMKTFTMPSAWVAKTEKPKQTSHLALAGRESQRACVRAKPCR